MKGNMSQAIKLGLAGCIGAGCLISSQAMARVEVEASASIASMYLYRGVDLGNGNAAVSGDLTLSISGLYAGVWGTSGDSSSGSEYDLYLGYGGESGGVKYDISVVNYVYPGSDPNADIDGVGDFSELILWVGLGPVALAYADNIAGDSGNEYYSAQFSMNAFSALIGYNDTEADDMDYAHLDLGYAYNENLSFTFSQIVFEEEEDLEAHDTDLKFVVSYSVPIK